MTGKANAFGQRFGARSNGAVYVPALNSVVCVSNPDAKRRLSLDECIIGRVNRIFSNKHGVICCDVNLFARPALFPANVDTKNYVLHQCREVVEDKCRTNVATFPVDDIFSECEVISGESETSVESILLKNSQQASSHKFNLPIFVLRFCLLERKSGGFFLQPLIPSPVQEMSLVMAEVLSETGTNVKWRGNSHSQEYNIKPSIVFLEDCGTRSKENVIGSENSKLTETVLKSPSKLVGSPQFKRFAVRRSLELDLDGPCNKRRCTESEAQLLSEKGKLVFSSTSQGLETDFGTSEELNELTQTAWVSKLLEVNEPVIPSGGQTPIRLSLKRVRPNVTPPKQPHTEQDKESDMEEACKKKSQTRKKKCDVNMENDSDAVTSKMKSEVLELETGNLDNANCRPSRRKSRMASEDPFFETDSASLRPRRTCRTTSTSCNGVIEASDFLMSLISPEESGIPLAIRTRSGTSRKNSRTASKDFIPETQDVTPRTRRASRATSTSCNGVVEAGDLMSPEESGVPSAIRTSRRNSRISCAEIKSETQAVAPRPTRACRSSSRSYIELPDESIMPEADITRGGTRKSSRGHRTSVRSPKLEQDKFTSVEEMTTPSKTTKSSEKTPKNVCKTPVKTPGKSPKTPKGKTPSRTPLKGCLTPSMPVRASAPLTPMSSLEQIRKNLHVSAVPMSLPCRESEYHSIYSFLENKIVDAAGGCMYISGVPGTGKTATVHAVIRALKEEVEEKQLKDFQYIEVNGLRLTEPRQVFVQVLKALTGQKCTPQQAQDILSQKFCSGSSKNKTVVLLVDEVDMLRNRRQDVIYNLFDWPSKPNSRLIVLTIANTMDLPERLLKGRVTSRLGLTRLTFQPYSYKQLQEIVMSRLQGSDCFNDEAVELVARKVAACSGDVRRALDICRRASELVQEGSPVTMPIVNKVLSQMMNSANVCSIKACSKLEKLFLQAVVSENERTGVEEATFFAVYRQFQSFCALASTAVINISEAMAVLNRLGASGLLLTEHSRADINQSIFLNVNTDDVHYALNNIAATS